MSDAVHNEDASGWFEHSHWWINTPGDDPRGAQYASAHESHHKQLQDSTTFGALTRVLHVVAQHTGNVAVRETARHLVRTSTQTHEAFASWAPAEALGWARDELTARYPGYGRFYAAVHGIVEAVQSPYLRFHAAHACARACMQTPGIDRALDRGLTRFTLADLRRNEQPDRRFTYLRRTPPDWAALARALDHRHRDDERWARLRDRAPLTADLFDPSLADLWEAVNRAVFGHVADHLRAGRHPVLDYDEQLDWTPPLIAAAETLLGAASGLKPGQRRSPHEAALTVLRNIDSEGFAVAPALAAQIQPPDTPLTAMAAGTDDQHLFLTIRVTASLAANYTGIDPAALSAPMGAFLRRTVPDGNATRVELLDVTTSFPTSRSDAPLPVLTTVSLSLLDSTTATRFAPYLRPEVSTILVDLPLEPHLHSWLSRPGVAFRHVFLRTEAAGHVVPVLVALLSAGEAAASSHLFIRPLSHAAVRIYKAGFQEIDPTGTRLVHDPAVLDTYPELLHLALSHVISEEIRFGPSE